MKTRTLRVCSMILALVFCLSAVSCAMQVSADELTAGYSRSKEAKQAVKAHEQLTDVEISALSGFTFRTLSAALNSPDAVTQDNGKGLLYSPLSAALCLGMITNGTDGETRAQLEDLLGLDSDALGLVLAALTAILPSTKDCRMETADSLWIRNDFPVKESFLQSTADWYGAEVYHTPMDDSTKDNVNKWCDEHTDGLIPKILENAPDPNTAMYLINALLFDAKWEEKYETDNVRSGAFTNADGTVDSVKFMHSEESVYLTGDGWYGVAKDYKGKNYSFVGLLPKNETTDVRELASALTGEEWLSLWKSRTTGTAVRTAIPEFKAASSIDLKTVLKSLGVTSAFEEGTADFSRLSDRPTWCDECRQKTVIEVDRNGTKAAAITWGGVMDEAAPALWVYLNRPFLYAVVDNATGLPLFVGIVEHVK